MQGWGSGAPSPPRGWQVALTGTVSAPLGRTQGAERSSGGIVQVARDSHVLLTQVGTQLGAGATSKHTCLGGCSGNRGHARRLSSEIPAQIWPHSAPAPSMPPPPLVLGMAPVAPKSSLAAAVPCKKQEDGGAPCGSWGLPPRGAQHPLGLKLGVLCGCLALQGHLGF